MNRAVVGRFLYWPSYLYLNFSTDTKMDYDIFDTLL